MLNTIANCETPISPSSDTKWLSGLYGSPSGPGVRERRHHRAERDDRRADEAGPDRHPVERGPRHDHAPSQPSSSEAKTGPSRQTRCGVPVDAHHDAAEARPDRAAHVLLHRHLEERLAARRRRADRVGLARRRACARAWRRPAARGGPRPAATSAASMGAGPQANAWSAHASYSGTQLGHVAVVAHRAVVGRDDVLDLVGQQARRVDLARGWRRRTAASPGGRRGSPRRRASGRPAMPRPPATSSRCRLRGSTSNGRPSGPSMSTVSPGRSCVNHSVPRPMTRKWIVMMPGRRRRSVLSENGRRRTRPGEVAGPHVDELAGPRAARDVRGVERLQPLARQDLPTLDELRCSEPHAHAVGLPSASSASSTSSTSSTSSWASASATAVAALAAALGAVRRPPATSGATDGNASASASARSPKTSVGS